MMEIHQRISLVEDHDKFITPPLGVMSMPNLDRDSALNDCISRKLKKNNLIYPAEQAPIILYPDLSIDGYRTCECRHLQEHKELFIIAVNNAVEILNRAEICHMDLRPENILYKVENGQFRIQVIDMEYAIKFGDCLPLSECFLKDCRYPYLDEYFQGNVMVLASTVHNTWFTLAITKWIHSDNEDFSNFMTEFRDILKCELGDELREAIRARPV